MTIATIEELAYLLKQAKKERLPQPIVFLGAGASKTGGVPLAGEIVDHILDKYKENPRVRILADDCKSYKKLMECLTPYERKELLNEYIDKAKINVTHIYLAQLLIEGYVDYVLTVNFDNLMLRALALFNFFPATYDLSNLKDLTTSSFKEKSVVYLHGQHHGLWLLNTDEEMAKVNEIVPPTLNSIKNQRPWIFIGYSGEDPIFEHIKKLGRFDNGLYWVTYHDNNPNDIICSELLEKANTNSFLVKGFDSDSFMLKLNSELNLPQPIIIDKPFTSLKQTLENIVDIDDKEHFEGVKKRLEIVKKDVDFSIQQFEEGTVNLNGNLKKQIDASLLKKQIIDGMLKANLNDEDIINLEVLSKTLKDEEIDSLMSNLYQNYGNTLSNLAKQNKDETLYVKSFEKFKKALELAPQKDGIYNNWGNAIAGLAELKSDEKLFDESFEKYKISTELNPTNSLAFINWGITIHELAKIKKSEKLYEKSFEKYKIALDLDKTNDKALNSWGNGLSNLAQIKKDEKLFKESFEKYKIAAGLNPKKYGIYNNWGIALQDLAKLKNDEKLYKECFEKYKKAIELNAKDDNVFSNLGSALHELGKLKNDEKLYKESLDYYKIATELNPKGYVAFSNWGVSLQDLAKLKNDKKIYEESLEKMNKAIELGDSCYNLACLYSIKNDKENALITLKASLESKDITVNFVLEDQDWENFVNDSDFIELLKNYPS